MVRCGSLTLSTGAAAFSNPSMANKVMAEAAEPAVKLDVPLDVEVGWGAHWGEAH